jgi:hypothetical protein
MCVSLARATDEEDGAATFASDASDIVTSFALRRRPLRGPTCLEFGQHFGEMAQVATTWQGFHGSFLAFAQYVRDGFPAHGLRFGRR